MLRIIMVVLAKAVVLYLALTILMVDLVLLEAAIPRYSTFEQPPFFQSAGLVMVIATGLSIVFRSRTPAVFAAVCLAYSALFFIFGQQVTWFIALVSAVAAISFFYRNKITEPVLALLPVIVGAWVFISFIYLPYFVWWIYYVVGQKGFLGAASEGLRTMQEQIIPTLMIFPVAVMYFLGKQHYRVFAPACLRILGKRQ